ncbi:hypothetical protein [Yersinia mollaretii]|uniref:hypothetical protein n=1 Tax=Yersinia mollaretii TaxID=33060 RepID=UPI0005E7BC21|nr:hypothetical protein [Yersinia mollaretii]MDN0110077.1 hypothetical protein [Yersinia mollaretii]PJE86051.1 hypothetical protein CU280_20095 [Yersinia mollaretii]CQD33756.1 Uncharacterised protein [Yersinia mollaretii]CQH07742.1 Uncharacterised protein [Yersinia mollaretii]
MSSIGTRASTAITKAFTNTMKAEFGGVDRFHKADMKSLAGMMKEIKNSPAAIGLFDRVDQHQANSLNQKIDTMISTLKNQNSRMLPAKMASLVGLRSQLTKITFTNQPKQNESTYYRDKEVKQNDIKNSHGNRSQGNLGFSGDVPSRRQDCN